MPTVPLHPAIVHVPLGLAFVIPLVAAAIAVAVQRQRLPRSALAVVVGLQLVVAGGGFVAMAIGDREAHRVEAVVGEPAVEAHEERAELFVWSSVAVLVAAAALLVVPARALGALSAAVVVGSAGVAALGVRAGHAGGQIVYTHGGAAAFGAHPPPAAVAADHDD
ncbi:MAG: DUF2231 domain-containing protein [Anaeromyxobacter sp.]